MERMKTGFLLGAATAAHQVEGNNTHSDFWQLEQMEHGGFTELSGDAVDHYHRYAEDIAALAAAGLNAYRFSLEWARIEPEEGHFCLEEVRHYRDVLDCCIEHGVTPVVTLHHFSSPAWLIRKGGWESESTVEYFARYADFVAKHLGSRMGYICTINEANMGIQVAVIAKRYMQQLMAQAARKEQPEGAGKNIQMGLNVEELIARRREQAAQETQQVFGVDIAETFITPRTEKGDGIICRAHAAARDRMKHRCPHLKIGLTLSLHDMQPQPGGEKEAARLWEEEFTHYLPSIAGDDFLGVQTYTRSLVDANGTLPAPEGAELTQMNYEFYPWGLGHVLRAVAANFSGELLVTENGIATADDTRRIAYIDVAMEEIRACIREGLSVKGYFYWSLLDNFEWQKGYSMTFGLIAVDRTTQQRFPKPSLRHLGEFAPQP